MSETHNSNGDIVASFIKESFADNYNRDGGIFSFDIIDLDENIHFSISYDMNFFRIEGHMGTQKYLITSDHTTQSESGPIWFALLEKARQMKRIDDIVANWLMFLFATVRERGI